MKFVLFSHPLTAHLPQLENLHLTERDENGWIDAHIFWNQLCQARMLQLNVMSARPAEIDTSFLIFPHFFTVFLFQFRIWNYALRRM